MKRLRAERVMSLRVAVDLRAVPVWLSAGLGDAALRACNVHVGQGSDRHVENKLEALLFVVNDVADLGAHTSMITRLAGGVVMDPISF